MISRAQRNLKGGIHLRAIGTAFALVLATVLAFSPAAVAQTFTVLHTFTGGADGGIPTAQLRMDRAGNLYGVAGSGGNQGPNCNAYGCGVAFKLTHTGSGWLFSTLYSFQGGTDGGGPDASLVQGPDGAFYSSAAYGGGSTCSYLNNPTCGLVYRLAPPSAFCKSASCQWNESVVYDFYGYDEGSNPGPIQFDQAGNIYGTTNSGGGSGCLLCGVVFELSPSNGGWAENVLYAFKGGSGDGYGPEGSLVFDQSGNIYGATAEGGVTYEGTVYELSPTQSGYTEKMLYEFQQAYSGASPFGLITDSAGNLYGATENGGAGGCGTAFRMTRSQGNWELVVLDNLSGGSGGCGPNAGLIMDAAGNLYGTTNRTGAYQKGVVFKLAPTGNGWVYTSLHDFTGGSDGFSPFGLTLDANGNLYGTTAFGAGQNCGGVGCGVVFEITP